jgi:hypothetical protein
LLDAFATLSTHSVRIFLHYRPCHELVNSYRSRNSVLAGLFTAFEPF